MEKSSVYPHRRGATAPRAPRGVRGHSQAEVIRRAIAAYEPPRAADRRFRLAGSYDGPGGSVAAIPEEELLQGLGE